MLPNPVVTAVISQVVPSHRRAAAGNGKMDASARLNEHEHEAEAAVKVDFGEGH